MPESIHSLDAAYAAFHAGHHDEALEHCRAILAAQPGHADALHLVSLVELQRGNAASACDHLRRALTIREDVRYLQALAIGLQHLQRYGEAEAIWLRVIALQPDLASAYCDLGLVLSRQPGRQAEAIAALRYALELNPDFPAALCNLGGILDNPAEAETMLRRALELQPDMAAGYCNLGALLLGSNRHAEAITTLRRAFELNPDSPATLVNLGGALADSQQTGEAETMLRRALALRPDMASAHANLGKVLKLSGRFDEAISSYQRTIELEQSNLQAHSNLGVLLLEMRRHAEAIATLRRALELNPDSPETLTNLGGALWADWQLGEAETVLRRAIAQQPDRSDAYLHLGNVFKASSRLDEAIASYRRAVELEPANLFAHSNLIFSMMFAHDDDEVIRREAERFSAQNETPLLGVPVPPYANERTRTHRLRIGYVSPNFYDHCQALFMTPLLAHHDHQAFEIFCYASVLNPDGITQHLASFADIWRDVHELSDEQLAQQIREDRIDVLVNLTMHMANGRPLLFARRPAPVQVAYLAYPGTTGSRAIGYRLTDPWLDPPNVPHADERYSERSLRLPDTFWCYDPLTTGLDVNALPALANGYITFGCLNNPCKVTQWTLRLWSAVLRAIPDARFILMAAPGEPRTTLQARFAERGVDPARVSFVPFQLHGDYLRTYWQMDMALDTFPYNGHTTSLDSFWMGVPVVTRTGRSAVSRGGLSLLANLQMLELAADNDEDYVRIAVRLASDLPKLAALRAQLRGRMERSPLMDSVRFTRNLEQAYRQMWGEWCAQQE